MSKLFVGPWVGEFGVELLWWQSHARAVADERRWDEVIVAAHPDRFFLYEDFAARFVSYQPPSEHVEVQKCGGHVYNGIHRQFIDECGGDMWLSPMFEGTSWHRISWELRRKRRYVDYSQRGRVPSRPYDILIHARATRKCGQEKKNWPVRNWETLVEGLRPEYRVASIGAKDGAHKIRGTTDLRGIALRDLAGHMAGARIVIGPSSGPMHFAVLSGCPVLTWVEPVWSWLYANEPYRSEWNPFSVPIACLLTWQPAVEIVMTRAREVLLLAESRRLPADYLVFGNKRSGHHAVLEWIGRLESGRSLVHWNDCVVNDVVSFPNRSFVLSQDWSLPKMLSSFEEPGQTIRRLGDAPHDLRNGAIRMLSFEDTAVEQVATIPETGQAQWLVFVLRDLANNLASLKKGIPELRRKGFSSRAFRRLTEAYKGYLREALALTDHLGCLRDKAVFVSYNRWHVDIEYRRALAQRLGFGPRDVDRSTVAQYGGGSGFDDVAVDAATMDVLGRWRWCEEDRSGFWMHVDDPELRELERRFHGDACPDLGVATCCVGQPSAGMHAMPLPESSPHVPYEVAMKNGTGVTSARARPFSCKGGTVTV